MLPMQRLQTLLLLAALFAVALPHRAGAQEDRGTAAMNEIHFTPDGERLASVTASRDIVVWDVATGEALATAGVSSNMPSLSWSSEGRLLASKMPDTGIRIWDTKTGTSLRTIDTQRALSNPVRLSPDGAYVAAVAGRGSDRATLLVWRLRDGAEIMRIERPHRTAGFVWGHASRSLVVSERDGAMYRWAVPSGERLARWPLQTNGPALGIEGTATPGLFISGGADGVLRLLDMDSRTIRQTMNHGAGINGAALSPDGRFAASVGNDGYLKAWSTATGALRFAVEAHPFLPHYVAIGPDGRRIATSGADAPSSFYLRLWDAQTGALVREIQGRGQ